MSNFTKIDKLIKYNAKEHNLEAALYRHKVIKTWGEIASAFVDGANKLTQAVDFKKGVLKIACLSREVASLIRLLAEKIVAAINEVIGKRVLFSIFVEV